MAVDRCPLCFEPLCGIDDLEDEVKRPPAVSGREQREVRDWLFDSSTPSSKKPVKKDVEQREDKPKGPRPGHQDQGSRGHEEGTSNRTVEAFPDAEFCPRCGNSLEKNEI